MASCPGMKPRISRLYVHVHNAYVLYTCPNFDLIRVYPYTSFKGSTYGSLVYGVLRCRFNLSMRLALYILTNSWTEVRLHLTGSIWDIQYQK